MKKIYLTLAASIMAVGLFAQAPVVLKSNLKNQHIEDGISKRQVKGSFELNPHTKSASRSTTISEWLNPITMISDYWGNTPYLSLTNPVFPDSNVMVAFSSGPDVPWLHSISQTIHVGGEYTTWSGGGVFDPAVQPFDPTGTFLIDSVSFHARYTQVDNSVVDTAIIYVIARGNGNYTRRLYAGNPDSAKYVIDYSGAPASNAPDGVLGTYKIPLDAAFIADSTSVGTNYITAAPGLSIVGSNGVIGFTLEYKPGKPYSQATDTIFSNMNFLSPVYGTPDGQSTNFPNGSVEDYTIGSFCNGANNKYGTLSYFPAPTQFGATDHPYQVYDMDVKISQTNALNAGINELDNGAKLFQNYPNPTNGNTTIKYSLENQANIAFELMDVTGKKVVSSNEGTKGSGTHSIELNTAELNAGIYFYSIVVNGNKLTKKLTITK